MNAPSTYYEWAQVIDRLAIAENDQEVLEAMRNGTLVWQMGVSVRFVKMLMDVVDDRLNRAVDKFQSILQTGNPDALMGGIASLRRELMFLRDVVSIDAIPSGSRDALIDHVVDFSTQIQSSLESSAGTDTSGKLLSVLKNNPVTIPRAETETARTDQSEGDDQ